MKNKYTFTFIALLFACQLAYSQANTTLSNLAATTAVSTNLLPGLTNARDLGSSSKGWKDFYLNGAIFNGPTPMMKFTPANNSVFIGPNTNTAQTGTENTVMGYLAGLDNTTGSANVFIGSNAGRRNTTGSGNTLVGREAGRFINTGSNNACFGNSSGQALDSGSGNTMIGIMAGWQTTSGGNNTFIGEGAGANNTTGNFNSTLGNSANLSVGNLEFATSIGWGAVCNASFKVRLGMTSVTVIEGQVPYSFPSDGRFKTNVQENVPGMDFISKLRPVTYNFQTKKFDEFLHQADPNYVAPDIDFSVSENIVQSGFIAQEVEQAAKELGYDFNGVHAPETEYDNYSMSYEVLVVPMVKAMQELDAKNQSIRTELEELRRLLTAMENEASDNNTGMSDSKVTPSTLGQNRPNPANDRTFIPFQIASDVKKATIVISNAQGIKISEHTLSNRGEGTFELNTTTLSNGNYVYTLIVDGVSTSSSVFSVVK